jgi:hypothetical protein
MDYNRSVLDGLMIQLDLTREERRTMASSNEYIRSIMAIRPTRDDKGVEFEFGKVRAMDNGMWMVGECPCDGPAQVGRVLLQMVEEAEKARRKRCAEPSAAA